MLTTLMFSFSVNHLDTFLSSCGLFRGYVIPDEAPFSAFTLFKERNSSSIKLSAVLSPSGTEVSFCVTFDLGSFAVHLGERWLVTGGQGKDRHNGEAESVKPGSSITLNQCASLARGATYHHQTSIPVCDFCGCE